MVLHNSVLQMKMMNNLACILCYLRLCCFFMFTQVQKGICKGGSRISGKKVHMYKGLGVRYADFMS